MRQGFNGPVYVSYDTGKLMSVVLPDSGRLLEEEAGYANKRGYSRHSPALALYTEDDAWAAIELLHAQPFDQRFSVAPDIEAAFQPAGHILGSAVMRLRLGDATMVSSGDLGRNHHPFLRAPARIGDADWVMIESTYGDRKHDSEEAVTELADVITRTADRGGVVVIPAFAVDRTEVLLFHLHHLALAGRLPQQDVLVQPVLPQARTHDRGEGRDAFVAVDERMVQCQRMHECGSLLRNVRIQVLSAKRRRGSRARALESTTVAETGAAAISPQLLRMQCQQLRDRQILDRH